MGLVAPSVLPGRSLVMSSTSARRPRSRVARPSPSRATARRSRRTGPATGNAPAGLGGAGAAGRCSRGSIVRRVRRVGGCREVRRVHGRKNRGGARRARAGHRPGHVDVDSVPADHPGAERADRQGHQGQEAKGGADHPGAASFGGSSARRSRHARRAAVHWAERGRISTAVLRDATHWDEVVVKLLSA